LETPQQRKRENGKKVLTVGYTILAKKLRDNKRNSYDLPEVSRWICCANQTCETKQKIRECFTFGASQSKTSAFAIETIAFAGQYVNRMCLQVQL
jgi:hypothetical protein